MKDPLGFCCSKKVPAAVEEEGSACTVGGMHKPATVEMEAAECGGAVILVRTEPDTESSLIRVSLVGKAVYAGGCCALRIRAGELLPTCVEGDDDGS